ncbi:unnamed protein product, partial [marine sediment metagenome]
NSLMDLDWNEDYFWLTYWNGSSGGMNAEKYNSDFDYLENVCLSCQSTTGAAKAWNGTNFITMTNEVLGNFKIWDEDFTYVNNKSFNYYTNGLKAITWNGTNYIANFNAFLTIFEDDYVYILDDG